MLTAATSSSAIPKAQLGTNSQLGQTATDGSSAIGYEERFRWRSRFASINDGSYRLESLDDVYAHFALPLQHWFGDRVLSDLRVMGSIASPLPDLSRLQLDHATISAAQHALLNSVVVTWGPALAENHALQQLLRLWFFGVSVPNSLDSTVHQDGKGKQRAVISDVHQSLQPGPTLILCDQQKSGTIQISSLRTLSSLTSSAKGKDQSDVGSDHAATQEAVEQVCRLGSDGFSLRSMLHAVLGEKSKAKRDLAWNEVVRLLLSLPDRIANYTQGKADESLQASAWFADVVSDGQVLLLAKAQQDFTTEKRQETISAIAEVLVRLERTAFLHPTSPSLSDGSPRTSFWPAFILSCHHRLLSSTAGRLPNHLLPESFERAWSATVSKCPARTRQRLCSSLSAFVSNAMSSRGLQHLVHPEERRKPGTEGSQLFSSQSVAFIAASSHLLLSLLPLEHRDAAGDLVASSDDDSDDEVFSNGRSPLRVFRQMALGGDGSTAALASNVVQFGPAMGWLFVEWLSLVQEEAKGNGPQHGLLTGALSATIEAWSKRDRIKSSTLEQEQYFTLLLVSLLATQRAGTTPLSQLASSAAFLDGVSCHLEHSDPHVRRMGMLAAEIVSAKSKDPTPSSMTAEGSSGGGKALDFGRAMWDGKGQGREEARVIRALHDAWHSHRKSMVIDLSSDHLDQAFDSCLEALGLRRGAHTRPSTSTETEGISGPGHKQRDAPASLRLPVLRPPPARKVVAEKSQARSLIMSLSDDEAEAHFTTDQQTAPSLQMFANESSRQRGQYDQDDDVELTSLGDENSSDDEPSRNVVDEQDEMARLAADLSGMTPAEARKATAQARPSSSLHGNDLDATREAHAPDFDKKKGLRPPVYISDLAPLLRSSGRDSVKMGLKCCAALVRRKQGWGGEVDENAVDLAFALCGLQNNLSIRRFEERRTEALAALVVASPRLLASCLSEQFFNHQYSMVQKLAILNALATGARQLSGHAVANPAKGIEGAVQKVTRSAIDRARQEGEKHVPAIQRSKNLSISPSQSTTTRQPGRFVTPLTSNQSPFALARPETGQRKITFASLATQFVQPLVLRFLAHLAEFQSRMTRRRLSRVGGGGTSYLGAGISGLFSPTLVSALLDTLCILVDLSTSSADFRPTISPTCLDLMLEVVRDPLALHDDDASERPTTGSDDAARAPSSGRTKTLASAFALLLVVLDRNAEQDGAAFLLSQCGQVVDTLAQATETTFALQESRRQAGAANAVTGAVGGDDARLARACAAILLLLEDIRERRHRQLAHKLGVAGF